MPLSTLLQEARCPSGATSADASDYPAASESFLFTPTRKCNFEATLALCLSSPRASCWSAPAANSATSAYYHSVHCDRSMIELRVIQDLSAELPCACNRALSPLFNRFRSRQEFIMLLRSRHIPNTPSNPLISLPISRRLHSCTPSHMLRAVPFSTANNYPSYHANENFVTSSARFQFDTRNFSSADRDDNAISASDAKNLWTTHTPPGFDRAVLPATSYGSRAFPAGSRHGPCMALGDAVPVPLPRNVSSTSPPLPDLTPIFFVLHIAGPKSESLGKRPTVCPFEHMRSNSNSSPNALIRQRLPDAPAELCRRRFAHILMLRPTSPDCKRKENASVAVSHVWLGIRFFHQEPSATKFRHVIRSQYCPSARIRCSTALPILLLRRSYRPITSRINHHPGENSTSQSHSIGITMCHLFLQPNNHITTPVRKLLHARISGSLFESATLPLRRYCRCVFRVPEIDCILAFQIEE
ncbi:hypothetical protein GGX14DRAFT_570306 [Mycena pura]|uniref:Uncharacterized protein n=1 Tax=Mycena pura TaxID=153505 RepID=A0AAD6YAW2_9AGAR|nr:hypothetical protein GGX14DRAFT_570306 [Mycena pura]